MERQRGGQGGLQSAGDIVSLCPWVLLLRGGGGFLQIHPVQPVLQVLPQLVGVGGVGSTFLGGDREGDPINTRPRGGATPSADPSGSEG